MRIGSNLSISRFLAVLVQLFCVAYCATTSQAQQPETLEFPGILAKIEGLDASVRVGMVVLDAQGEPVFTHHPHQEMAAASSIKTAILLELFDQFSDELLQGGRSDIAQILGDGEHPAIVHFNQETQRQIVKDLKSVSIRRLGKIMIDSDDEDGTPYENTTYNAAANVAIALLGGPAETTERIHRRHAALRGLHVRRYMLADRNVTGDNTASPAGLAHAFFLVVGRIPEGVSPPVAEEISKILHSVDYPDGAVMFAKSGALVSNPVTCVRSGQFQHAGNRLNYAVMLSQERRSPTSGRIQYETLSELASEIVNLLIEESSS